MQMELTVLSGKGFFMKFLMKKRMGLLGLGSAVLIAAAALGMHGFPVLGTEAGQEAQLNSGAGRMDGNAAEPGKDALEKEYPADEFFETETDMTEFEGKLEDITA